MASLIFLCVILSEVLRFACETQYAVEGPLYSEHRSCYSAVSILHVAGNPNIKSFSAYIGVLRLVGIVRERTILLAQDDISRWEHHWGSAKTSAVKASSFGTGLPGVGRQAGFPAGLFEEGDAVPSVLERHLRQQQAATVPQADQQAVASNLHLLRLHGLERREHAEGDAQFRDLVPGDWRKTRVVKSRAARAFCDRTVKRSDGKHVTDASPQLAAVIQAS